MAKKALTPRVQIPVATGYVVTDAEQMPGLSEVMTRLRSFTSQKLRTINCEAIRVGAMRGSIKPFYFNLLDRADTQQMPEIVQFAVSDEVLGVLACYYGVLPELSHIAVFYSGFAEAFAAGSNPRGTQKMHWDNHDRRHVKMFCYLDDVGEEDGPLTVLPADKSWFLRRKTGRILGTFPLQDAEFLRYFSEKDLVPITGPAGTVAFVDTTRCLHFGSRCGAGGNRTAFVIHYTRFADYSRAYTGPFQDLNLATSPECREQLTLSPTGDVAYRLLSPSNT